MESETNNPYAPPMAPAASFQSTSWDSREVEEDDQYNDASNAKRFLNWLLDQAAIFGVIALTVMGANYLNEMGISEPLVWIDGLSEGNAPLTEVGIWFAYYVLMESLFGLTLGKLATGTRVVDSSGEKPGLMTILGRSLTRLVPFEPLSFFGRAGWHDRWSGTRVIDLRVPGPRLSPALRRF